MKETLDQLLTQGLNILVQLAALAVFVGMALLRKKVNEYLAAHLDAKQMEILHLLAAEAYAFAETTYKHLQGHEKMSRALDYLEGMARLKGIPFDAAAAKAAIEKAWLETEGIRKKQSINISAPTIQTGTAVSLDQKTPDTYLG